MEFVHVELKRDTWLDVDAKIKNPVDAVFEVQKMIGNLDREMLVSLNIATDGSVINASVCSVGSSECSIFSLAEIFRVAIVSGATSLILLHNHPSGNITPSSEDLKVTRKATLMGYLLNLQVLDHIVIGSKDTFCSMADDYKSCFEINKNDFERLLTEIRS